MRVHVSNFKNHNMIIKEVEMVVLALIHEMPVSLWEENHLLTREIRDSYYSPLDFGEGNFLIVQYSQIFVGLTFLWTYNKDVR